MIGVIDSIYSGYIDSIYKSAAVELPNAYLPKMSALLLIYFAFQILRYWYLKIRVDDSPKIDTVLNYTFVALTFNSIFFALTLAGLSIFIIARPDYVQRIMAYSQSSLVILHPYIGNNKYIVLKSQHEQITSADSFERFNGEVTHLVRMHGLTLREFDPLK